MTPPGGFTCGQQAAWGICNADFMTAGGYCAATCGRCGSTAPVPTPQVAASPSSPSASVVGAHTPLETFVQGRPLLG